MAFAVTILPAVVGTASAANSTWISNCGVKLRQTPWTSSTVRKLIDKGVAVTASGSVTGGWWSADCGTHVSGRTWLKIIAVGGKSVSSLTGAAAVYAASGLFHAAPAPAAVTVNYLTSCSARLRTYASTAAATKSIIAKDAVVTSSGKVTGSSWSAACATSVSGNTWYKITAVGGRSVKTLYGVSAVYAATGLFRGMSSTGSLYGIDVSKWQGTIDWARVRAAGKRFAFGKATEGVSVVDSTYARNKSGAMANGIAFGAYHFAQPANDPTREADWFVNNAGYKHGMLVPVLDLERTGGRSTAGLQSWVKTFLARVKYRLGVKPMIYTSPGFWRSYMGDTRWFADNGYSMLWVAHWTSGSPSVPGSNWGGRSWTFWQYSETGRVPGISTNVDLNRYHYASLAPVTY